MLEKLPDAVGHALRDSRAGLDKIVFNTLGMRAGMGAIAVTSLAFVDHAPIPLNYTDDGEGLSPPLQWAQVPDGATSIALIVEDADAPTPQPLVHAIVVNSIRLRLPWPKARWTAPITRVSVSRPGATPS